MSLVVAAVEMELHIPMSGSLKGKRGVLKPLVERLRRELNVSVAEVGHQDLWQRAVLGMAVAAGSEIGARKVVQSAEAVVAREPRVEVVRVDVDVVVGEF